MGQIRIDYSQLEQSRTHLETITIRGGDGIKAVNDSSLEVLESCTSRIYETSVQLTQTVSEYDSFLSQLAQEFKNQEKAIEQQFDSLPKLSAPSSQTSTSGRRTNASDSFFAS